MVGLIIAFPGIVSSGLDKAEAIDLDKVRIEMEANMPAPIEQEDPSAVSGIGADATKIDEENSKSESSPGVKR